MFFAPTRFIAGESMGKEKGGKWFLLLEQI